MPADYRSTMGYLALQEAQHARNLQAQRLKDQREEQMQKEMLDMRGYQTATRGTLGAMEQAVRAIGDQKRYEAAMARAMAEAEGELGVDRLEYQSQPVDYAAEVGHVEGMAKKARQDAIGGRYGKTPEELDYLNKLLGVRKDELSGRAKLGGQRLAAQKDSDMLRLLIARMNLDKSITESEGAAILKNLDSIPLTERDFLGQDVPIAGAAENRAALVAEALRRLGGARERNIPGGRKQNTNAAQQGTKVPSSSASSSQAATNALDFSNAAPTVLDNPSAETDDERIRRAAGF